MKGLQKVVFSLLAVIALTSCNKSDKIHDVVMNAHRDGMLNGVVLVAENGVQLLHQSYGIATPILQQQLTVQHRFQLGSIYKQFPGVATMVLVEANKLDLNQPISTYLNGYPDWANQVTAQQLLTYSSGLPVVPWPELFEQHQVVRQQDLLASLMNLEQLSAAPGEQYIYSNYSPFLLIQLIEAISGESYEAFIKKALWEPAGMTDTVLAKQYPYVDERLMAIPFDNQQQVDTMTYALPPMSMVVTAADMQRWLQALYNFKIISKSSLRQLSERVGAQAPIGEMEWQGEQITYHHHHGSSGNFEAVVRYYAERGRIIVILTNQKHGNVSDIADALAEAAPR